MDDTCWATRPGLTGNQRRCKRPRWGGTDFCYQHAIANGDAMVVTEQQLASLFPDDRMLGHRLWRRLKESRP